MLYPSRHEVFGLVPLEALLCGSPVIVCNDSGAGELIERVGGGEVVPVDDVDSLAYAIASMLASNASWRDRARMAGRKVRQFFDADVICERLDAVYREVIDCSVAEGRRSA